MTLYSIPWQFDSIPNIGTENRVGSDRVGSKIIGIDSGFGSIPRVGTVWSGRFLKLEPKPDPTVSLKIVILFFFLLANFDKTISNFSVSIFN